MSRRKLFLEAQNANIRSNIDEERGKLLEAAFLVESALDEFEGLVFSEAQRGGESNDVDVGREHDPVIDLLVAALTSVPGTLLQKYYKLESSGGTIGQDSHQYLSSMEESCFNAACISSDVILKYFLDETQMVLHLGGCLGESHIYELVEQLASLCESPHGMGVIIICPIVRLLNVLAENRHMERILVEKEGINNQEFEYHPPPSLFTMPAKDTLRLIQMLLRLIFEEHSSGLEEMSSHVALFTSYLLEHFADMTLAETGYASFDECESLFRLWADGMNEHMTRRLNDRDASDVPHLISQFQIENIQTALQFIERAEALIESFAKGEMNDETRDQNVDCCIAAVQDCIRHVVMAVTVTEAVEKLGLYLDPEIRVIFNPLLVAFATFVASGLQDAMHLVVRLLHLADDLLLRLCHTDLGVEFLKQLDCDNRQDQIITIALLRALESNCISGKGRFLLEIAADRAQTAGAGNNSDPFPKRQRFSRLGGQPSYIMDMSGSSGTDDCTKDQRDLAEVLIMCMTLSQSYHEGGMDKTAVEESSCIASSLITDRDSTNVVLDPLNPWHSLNVTSLKELTSTLEISADDETDAISSYVLSVPSCLNTRATNNSI